MYKMFLISDANFKKIKNCTNDQLPINIYNDFFNEIIDNSYNINVKNISNFYILIGDILSETELEDYEEAYEDILNNDQYNYIKSNKKIILGCLIISKSKIKNNIHYIEHIESYVKKCNIANTMIEKYKLLFQDIKLIPKIFTLQSINYWFYKQYWNSYTQYNNYIKELEKDFYIDEIKDEINWDVYFNRIEEEKNKNIELEIII